MNQRNYEKEIIDYLMEHHPVRTRWYKPELKQITKEWELDKDFNLVPEEAEELLIDVMNKFEIDYSSIDFSHYIEYEYPFWRKKPDIEIKPLTVQMIIESAKAGKWLYD